MDALEDTAGQGASAHLGLILLIGLREDLDVVEQTERKDIAEGLASILSIVQLPLLHIHKCTDPLLLSMLQLLWCTADHCP